MLPLTALTLPPETIAVARTSDWRSAAVPIGCRKSARPTLLRSRAAYLVPRVSNRCPWHSQPDYPGNAAVGNSELIGLSQHLSPVARRHLPSDAVQWPE